MCVSISSVSALYSWTSVARTWMAHLPWLIWTRFWVPTHFFRYFQKTKHLWKFSYFIMKLNVVCTPILESHPGYFTEFTQHNITVQKIKKTFLNYRHFFPDLASWLPLSGVNKFPWSQRHSSHWSLTVILFSVIRLCFSLSFPLLALLFVFSLFLRDKKWPTRVDVPFIKNQTNLNKSV